MEDIITNTINTIIQYKEQSHRIAILINLYYLGEILNRITNPRRIWKNHLENYPLPNHGRYYRAATRVYEIFNNNVEQIYRTKHMSMHYISGMTNEDYHNNFLPFVKNLGSEDFAF